jgi:hypothetical protein
MALSAPLLTRKRVLQTKIESAKGTKVTGDQALLVFDMDINPTAPYEERKGTGLYRGHSIPGSHGERSGSLSFSTELRGTGAHGMEAGLAILLQACGFKKSSESYQVHSTHTDDKTLSFDVSEDGVLKGLAGASGNITFEGDAGKRVMCKCDFSGIWQAPTDAALPAYAPSTTKPLLLQGGTFSLATLAIKLSKFSLNMGNSVAARMDVTAAGGIAYYIITDYDPILSLSVEADKVAGYDFFGAWLAGTEAAVSLVVTDGTDIVTFTIPKVQYKEIKEADSNGIQIYDITGQCNHSSGNYAVTIAVT